MTLVPEGDPSGIRNTLLMEPCTVGGQTFHAFLYRKHTEVFEKDIWAALSACQDNPFPRQAIFLHANSHPGFVYACKWSCFVYAC